VTDTDPLTEIERAFEVVSQGFDAGFGGIDVDVVDRDDAFVLYADVPGVDPEAVEVRIGDGREVTVAVTTDRESEIEDGEFVIRERTHRSTSRTVSLPAPVEEDEASAGIDDGVLEVVLPKRAREAEGTEIPVE